jgi:hypothetical protein
MLSFRTNGSNNLNLMKIKLLTIIIYLSVIGYATAQTPSWVWSRSGGSVSNDYSNATCTDANGNVYITGTFQGSSIILGNDTLHNNFTGSLAVFVAKYDANGNVLWARSGSGPSDDYSYGICTDVNGNVFIEGHSYGSSITFDTVTLTNSVNQFIFIVKYDSIGNLQWGKNGKGVTSVGWGICSDVAGNVYLFGNSYSNNIVFENDTLIKGAFIVKYDGGGNVVWAKMIATDLVANSREQSMCADAYGSIYVTGAFQNQTIFGSDTLSANGFGVFLAKYDASSNCLWVKSASSVAGGGGVGNAIAADANGNIYLTGYFGSTIAFGNDTLAGLPFSSCTIFIAKYDSSGNALWGRTPGGAGYDFGQSICTDALGNVFVTGYFISSFLNFGGYPVVNSFTGNNDGYIAAYDGTGNALWAQGVGNQGNDYGMGICANTGGDIYLTGYFTSFSLNFGSNLVTNNGSADFFLAKLTAPTGINEYFFDNDIPIIIYPNPSPTGEFNISSFQFPLQKIEIFNSLGKKVYSETASKASIKKINLKHISDGIYFVNVFNGNKSYCKKLVVKH